MSIAIPERIECCVTSGERPVEGLMIRAELKIPQKIAYDIVIGPTASNGRATILRADIERQAKRQFDSSVMDYNLLTGSFNGVIEVSVMKSEDLAKALRDHEKNKEGSAFPKDYQNHLGNSAKILAALPSLKNLRLTVSVSSPFTRVIVK